MGHSQSATVSVVIPCFNGMPYLPQAIDSALAQTHRPIEIIVVDDGSKDDSGACVREYQRRCPERGIQLIQQANAGEPAARNAGIAATSAAWIAMLDSDDWWEARKLSLQLRAAEQAGPACVLVHTGFIRHYPDGRAMAWDMTGAARRVGWCTEALLEPYSIGHPSIMVRRDALDRIGAYDAAFRQACDIDLYFRLSAVGTFAFVPDYLLHYRVHARQMSTSQIDQIPFHHGAVRKFFAQHPDMAHTIGAERIEQALAHHVAMKIESLYWRRQLDDFRRLLDWARQQDLHSPAIDRWRRRSRWPNWAIQLRDHFSTDRKRQLRAVNQTTV